MTYSNDLNGIPIPPLRDLPKPKDPTVIFYDSRIKLEEVRDIVHKACAGSAPSLNGLSYKLYKNCPRVLRKLTVLLQQDWKKGIVLRESLYKCICPEGWDTWLPRMSRTFTNDMEHNTLS